jgi:hypothetical protein
MQMRRVSVAAVLAVLAPVVVTGVGAHEAKRSMCQRMSGRDLAPSRIVKLVKKANEGGGTDLVGCVLPAGSRFTIASSGELATQSKRYRLRQVAGRIVLVRGLYGSQYGQSENVLVADVRTGRNYRVAFYDSPLGSPTDYGETAPAAFVTKGGRAVAALLGVDGTVTIATFDPSGNQTDLDSGPLAQIPWASLTLDGTTATWTHGGAARSVDISSAG